MPTTFPNKPRSFPNKCLSFPNKCLGFQNKCLSFPNKCLSFPNKCLGFPNICLSFPNKPRVFPNKPRIFPNMCLGFPNKCLSFPKWLLFNILGFLGVKKGIAVNYGSKPFDKLRVTRFMNGDTLEIALRPLSSSPIRIFVLFVFRKVPQFVYSYYSYFVKFPYSYIRTIRIS